MSRVGRTPIAVPSGVDVSVTGSRTGNGRSQPMRGGTGGGLPARLFREIAEEMR